MSALIPIDFELFPFFKIPTTPVLAIPECTSIPKSFKSVETFAAAYSSSKLICGCICRS